jgi:hypothetical protein
MIKKACIDVDASDSIALLISLITLARLPQAAEAFA